jgi:hypothetical protein
MNSSRKVMTPATSEKIRVFKYKFREAVVPDVVFKGVECLSTSELVLRVGLDMAIYMD